MNRYLFPKINRTEIDMLITALTSHLDKLVLLESTGNLDTEAYHAMHGEYQALREYLKTFMAGAA